MHHFKRIHTTLRVCVIKYTVFAICIKLSSTSVTYIVLEMFSLAFRGNRIHYVTKESSDKIAKLWQLLPMRF